MLLSYLYERFAQPEYTYRHRWQVGDLLIWDNRCVQHRVVGDTDGQHRDLHRVTVAVDCRHREQGSAGRRGSRGSGR